MIIRFLDIESIPYIKNLFDVYKENVLGTHDDLYKAISKYVSTNKIPPSIYNSLYNGKFQISRLELNKDFGLFFGTFSRFHRPIPSTVSAQGLLNFDIVYKTMVNNRMIKKKIYPNESNVDIYLSVK